MVHICLLAYLDKIPNYDITFNLMTCVSKSRVSLPTMNIQVTDQIGPVNISAIFNKIAPTSNPAHTKSPPH